GFLEEINVSCRVFPKSLQPFKDRRIVGIKDDLINTAGPVGRAIKPDAQAKEKPGRKVQPAEWEPAQPTAETPAAKVKKIFKVTIRFAASADVVQKAEANSKKEAKDLALEQALMPDFRSGTV